MQIVVFSTKPYDRQFLDAANGGQHQITYLEARLTPATAALAHGAVAVCAFVNDVVNAEVLGQFAGHGVQIIALRSAGFNNVDLAAAKAHGITIARVPAYSPAAISEHTVALMLSLDRRIHKAYARVRDGNFSLDGLLGFNLQGRTVGVVGTGKIGAGFAKIMLAFGCKVVAYDVFPSEDLASLGVAYVPLSELFAISDVISLHCPLTPETYHVIDARSIATMKRGVMVLNTGRGGLIDTQAVIDGLKSGQIGHVGLDVYEEEQELFFEDRSEAVIADDVFERLMTFPNVLVTGHQGFFTQEALAAIAETTIANVTAFETKGQALHPVA